MHPIYVKVQIQGYSRKELVAIDANSKKGSHQEKAVLIDCLFLWAKIKEIYFRYSIFESSIYSCKKRGSDVKIHFRVQDRRVLDVNSYLGVQDR